VIAEETRELERRERAYRGERRRPNLEGKTVILVDDGLVTGATMRAAALAVRNAVGIWYEDFSQTRDDEVREPLARAAEIRASSPRLDPKRPLGALTSRGPNMATELQAEQGIMRVPTGIWRVDPTHSSVEFEVKHMMITTVLGRFRDFEGTIEAADDIADSRVFGAVKAASIDTNDETRDAHLRSADLLDGERYPEIRFESSTIEPIGGPNFRLVGNRSQGRDSRGRARCDRRRRGARPLGERARRNSSPWQAQSPRFRVDVAADAGVRRVPRGEEVNVLVDVSAVKAT
jgi:polyisoprenoid-binding protein YceI